MSTYSIASAIEKLAKNFKDAIDDRNNIEKEKLAFEREKFEFEKNKVTYGHKEECEHEWRYGIQSSVGHHYICTKCGTTKVVPLENLSSTDKECDHDWYFDSHMISLGAEKEKYVCNKCGKVKWTDGVWFK